MKKNPIYGKFSMRDYHLKGPLGYGLYQGDFLESVTPPDEFSPTDISGLTIWFDVSDEDTVTKDGFGNTTALADKSGNSYNVTKSGGADPLWRDARINGLPSITFTAATLTNLRRAKIAALQGLSGLSVFHVGGAGGAAVFHGFDLNNRTQVLSDFTDNNSYAIVANGSGSFLSFNSLPSNYQRWDFIFDGSLATNANRLKCYINSVLQTTAYTGTIPATTENNASSKFGIGVIDIGTPVYTGGEIGEVIMYNRALSVSEREQVQEYLSTKWGI